MSEIIQQNHVMHLRVNFVLAWYLVAIYNYTGLKRAQGKMLFTYTNMDCLIYCFKNEDHR